MIRDRGNIKWASMMLPEHVKLLKEYNKNLKKTEKPILDEQKYEEFNKVISDSLEENQPLIVTYYEKGELKKVSGQIHSINHLNRRLEVKSSRYNHHLIHLDNIIELEQN